MLGVFSRLSGIRVGFLRKDGGNMEEVLCGRRSKEVIFGGRYGGKNTHWQREWVAVVHLMLTPGSPITSSLSCSGRLSWAARVERCGGARWRQEEASPKTPPHTQLLSFLEWKTCPLTLPPLCPLSVTWLCLSYV